MNSREDYRMGYLWQTDELICYDVINPTQYVFHEDNHVRDIPIPLLKNQDIQRQINKLALQASEKRYQAYMLEQQALQIMDNEVIYAK